jgi:hypothetical protein
LWPPAAGSTRGGGRRRELSTEGRPDFKAGLEWTQGMVGPGPGSSYSRIKNSSRQRRIQRFREAMSVTRATQGVQRSPTAVARLRGSDRCGHTRRRSSPRRRRQRLPKRTAWDLPDEDWRAGSGTARRLRAACAHPRQAPNNRLGQSGFAGPARARAEVRPVVVRRRSRPCSAATSTTVVTWLEFIDAPCRRIAPFIRRRRSHVNVAAAQGPENEWRMR